MNPWHFIWYGTGWFVLGSFGFMVLAFLWLRIVTPLLSLFVVWRRYRHTRNVAPQVGDIWFQGDTPLRITNIKDGRICMTSGNASWSDSPSGWVERVRNRRVWKAKS